ncbi:MAG: PDZ domain-containing protein [Firmicutes bacterium]|nr:PDZ domain-containing protein [Bacillota bacterium]
MAGAIAASLVVVLLLTLVLQINWSPQATLAGDVGNAGAQAQPAQLQIPTEPNTIADIVEATGPAVVKIETRTTVRGSATMDPFLNDPFFRQFFGGSFQSRPRVSQGLGSGFIITKDGYILTNEHVVDGADEISVTILGYDQPLPAKLIGADHDLDLAVLKVEAEKDLPFLQLGESDKTRVGEWVIAIGNPYGLDHTVTVGVISAKGRPVTVQDRQYRNLLQTDASINPGNSGGPLLNLRGEVIGINTAVNAQAQGIGFAIPTSTVQGVLKDLINNGKVAHPWLGVSLLPVTKEIARSLGLEQAVGAVVNGVVSGSPAERAGLKAGDVIQEYNGVAIKNPQDLVEQVAQTPVGSQVVVKLNRKGKTQEITVTIGEKQTKNL